MNNHQTKPVLVLDADMVSSLSIARSLQRQGLTLDLAHDEDQPEPPVAAYTRCARQVLTYPSPLTAPERFSHWVVEQLAADAYSLVIPVTERTLVALARHAGISPWLSRITIPPRDALEKVLVKSKTLELADELGVPYPARRLIGDVPALEQLAGELEYPVVLKPQSTLAGGPETGLSQIAVDYAFDPDELLKKGRNLLEQTPFLLQDYVRGDGVGIELIADHGEIRLAFQHRRIHELPLSGGGSCYRESVPVDAGLLDASARLIKALNWHGVAMVEFKQNVQQQRFWLMEINGRFWGSLPLSVAAGADFPWLLYQLYQGQDLRDESMQVVTGIHCRKLADDLIWYEQVLRGHGDPRLFDKPPAKVLLRQALRVFTPSHRFDVQTFSDIKPGLVDLYRIARTQVRRVSGALKQRREKKRLASREERQRIHERLGRARRILFVCYGNINRSALAEALLQQAPADEDDRIEVRSAGFHPVSGRPADPNMVAEAARHGIDLKMSASTILDEKLIEWADMLFVMEIPQRERLLRIAPTAASKTALLGSLAPRSGDPEIPDPYGQPPGIYTQCYERIAQSVHAIRDAIKSGTD